MKNEKCRIIIVISMLLTLLIPTVLTAKRRMITFEMGESGQTVKFKWNSSQ